MHPQRETLEFDIVFVGGGPANLASAIHLQRLLKSRNMSAEIALVDKGRYAGAHLLSGAIFDPRAILEFYPDFSESGCPLEAEVSKESVWFLTGKKKVPIPFLPEPFSSRGCKLVSLSRLGSWMADAAMNEGVQLFDSTAASVPVIENGRLCGIVTDDKGIDRNYREKPNFEPGAILKAKAFVIGEGSRGSLLGQLSALTGPVLSCGIRYCSSGSKETWRVPEGRLSSGEIMHFFGYPLPSGQYGGGWIYALSATLFSAGFVTSLRTSAPLCDPHLNLQLFKQHPFVHSMLEGGTMIESGARSITAETFDELPLLYGPGFLVTGESAGMVNLQRQKGIHLAMKSGTLAAETLFECFLQDNFSVENLKSYACRFKDSWAYKELHDARDYRKAFDRGLYAGLVQAGLQVKVPGFSYSAAGGKSRNTVALPPAAETGAFTGMKKRFKPDGILTFGKEECLYRSGTVHEEDQPCHLIIRPEDIENICLGKCRTEYGNPCNHFCPAGVYEVTHDPAPSFSLHPSNCLHCKTCEIADPYGIITWATPEGGGGPGYKVG